MWFFWGDHSTTMAHWGEKIRDPVPAKFKHVTKIVTCTLLCVMWSRTCQALWNFQKADFKPYYAGKNTLLFVFPDMGCSLKIFALRIPLHANVFSFTYNAVILLQFRCVHPENQTQFFRFWYFHESKQMLLTQDLKWLLPPVTTASKHGCQQSSLLLYSISVD